MHHGVDTNATLHLTYTGPQIEIDNGGDIDRDNERDRNRDGDNERDRDRHSSPYLRTALVTHDIPWHGEAVIHDGLCVMNRSL